MEARFANPFAAENEESLGFRIKGSVVLGSDTFLQLYVFGVISEGRKG